MILFVAPNKEGLGVIMENSTTGWPETASIGCLKETIALFKEEMIVDKFLLNFFAHAGQRIESSFQFVGQTG